MELLIEGLDIGRLDEVAEIFLKCLKVQYKGVLPDSVVDNFDFNDSKNLWKKSFENNIGYSFLGAFKSGKLVGFTKFGNDPEDSSFGYVASLYVDPHHAGHGYGAILMKTAIDALATFPKIRLWVFETNDRAIGLYEKLGFRKTGLTRVEAEWKTNQVQMELNNF